jgi:glutamate synthase (NADPH/NADH) small chain
MELGEPDASGRRSPVPVEGKTLTLDVDQVIVAIGVSPNPLVPKSIEGLELGRKNTIAVSEQMQSSRSEIFAGGDIVRGGATVILAMGDGRRAAQNMHEYLEKCRPSGQHFFYHFTFFPLLSLLILSSAVTT